MVRGEGVCSCELSSTCQQLCQSAHHEVTQVLSTIFRLQIVVYQLGQRANPWNIVTPELSSAVRTIQICLKCIRVARITSWFLYIISQLYNMYYIIGLGTLSVFKQNLKLNLFTAKLLGIVVIFVSNTFHLMLTYMCYLQQVVIILYLKCSTELENKKVKPRSVHTSNLGKSIVLILL